MMEAAIQRRFPAGVKVHVQSSDRFGCLAELTHTLHDNQLSITRAKVPALLEPGVWLLNVQHDKHDILAPCGTIGWAAGWLTLGIALALHPCTTLPAVPPCRPHIWKGSCHLGSVAVEGKDAAGRHILHMHHAFCCLARAPES